MQPANEYVVIDCETLHSALDCIHCGMPEDAHLHFEGRDSRLRYCTSLPQRAFTPIGWDSKPELGLSIGCSYWSALGRTTFFDVHNLEDIMRQWVEEQPLLVTFNGYTFDLPLLRGILRRQAETMPAEDALALRALCQAFDIQCDGPCHYDLLQEIWAADPDSKRVKGLNGLGALAQANGFGGKTGDGAQAPRDWAAGRYAQVATYCQNDVYLTKALFELVLRGAPLCRSDGSRLVLPIPPLAQGGDIP